MTRCPPAASQAESWPSPAPTSTPDAPAGTAAPTALSRGRRLGREADVLVWSLPVVADHYLAELRLVAGDVLGQEPGQQLEVVRAHPDPRVDADQPGLLGSPLAEVEHEAQWAAVDEDHVGVDDLAGRFVDLDLDRELAHSITARTWPSRTTSFSLTRISLTVPATGATTGISIFIDSRMISTSSSATWSPGLASTFQTLPTSSAFTSVTRSAPAAGGPRRRSPPHDPARGTS